MPSVLNTTPLLLAICIVTLPLATAFTTPLSRAPTKRTKLAFYIGEEGHGGGLPSGLPEQYPMDPQYSPQSSDRGFEAMVYGHAVECANYPGLCAIDELMDLAHDLEEFQECFVEYGPEACQQEMEDRHMLADALMAQREIEIQNMERMQFGGDGMMYGNGFNSDQTMYENNRYQNRATPNNRKDSRTSHDRTGFIDA